MVCVFHKLVTFTCTAAMLAEQVLFLAVSVCLCKTENLLIRFLVTFDLESYFRIFG